VTRRTLFTAAAGVAAANRANGDNAFNLYTVAESTRPVTASGGLKLVRITYSATLPRLR
jgi:hypothetical protein